MVLGQAGSAYFFFSRRSDEIIESASHRIGTIET
jgi:acyl-coenzyme A synthetase/AMP-(fatty) acid ligase